MRLSRKEVQQIMKAQRRRDYPNNPALGRNIVWGQSYPGVQAFEAFGSPDELSAQIIAEFESRKAKLREAWWTIRDNEGKLQFQEFKFDMAFSALNLAYRSAFETYNNSRNYFDFIKAAFLFNLRVTGWTVTKYDVSWDGSVGSENFFKFHWNNQASKSPNTFFTRIYNGQPVGPARFTFGVSSAIPREWMRNETTKSSLRQIFTAFINKWHSENYAFYNDAPASLNFQKRMDLKTDAVQMPELGNKFMDTGAGVKIPSKWNSADKAYFLPLVAGDDYVDKIRDALTDGLNQYFDVFYNFWEAVRDGAAIESEINSRKATFDADAKSLKDFVVKYKDILQGVDPNTVVADILASQRPKPEPVKTLVVAPPVVPQQKTDLPVVQEAKTVAAKESKSNTGLIVAGAIAAAAALLMR